MNLIFVPLGYIAKANSSPNLKRANCIRSIYLKNALVALASLKKNSNSDIALVTNFEINQKYRVLFEKFKIRIIYADFDSFKFPNSYPWCLAFYKLCALNYVVSNFYYDNYMMLDSDIYALNNVDVIFKKSVEKTLFYNHGGSISIDSSFSGIKELLKNRNIVKRAGGEFLTINHLYAKDYIRIATKIFNYMQSKNIVINYGDEFITSVVANLIENSYFIGNEIIARCWTGTYREIPYNFEASLIVHVPVEKKSGMLNIYNYIVRHNSLPNNCYVIKKLHLNNSSFVCKLKRTLKKLFRRGL